LGSCYFYNSSSASYTVHRSACQQLGGTLVGFASAEEQRSVEDYFVRNTKVITGGLPAAPFAKHVALLALGFGAGRPSMQTHHICAGRVFIRTFRAH
jgi:hypothetical protein